MIDAELKGKDKKSVLTTTGELNRNHPYWHQVQGEIAATGVSWAHFVVWTTIDMQIINVERDPLWEKPYLPTLTEFYLTELLPSYCMDLALS